MVIKKGDFVEIDFVGRIKDSGNIFDLTKKDIAEKEKISNKSADYSPRMICIGNNDIVKGLDSFLEGKEVGKKYTVDLSAEDSFGKKNAKLIKMMPLNIFKKQKMNPFPGLQVNIDGMFGVIRTVSGGRVLVDFNHPLSGKEVSYEIEVKRLIKNDGEKISGIIKGLIGKNIKCDVKNGTAIVEWDVPKEFQKTISDRILKLVKTVKKLEFNKPVIKKENKNKK